MHLSRFTAGLLSNGNVTIAGELLSFTMEDKGSATELLERFHARDLLHMPSTAPAFNAAAALWAIQYLYQAIAFTLQRQHGAEKITEVLLPWEGPVDASVIYSADLSLRHLPSLLKLAKGLSPEDPLVKHLLQTALHWPLSSVGMPLEQQPDLQVILEDPSLRITYTDRIIAAKDVKRCKDAAVQALVEEALGEHTAMLWPDYTLHV